MKTTGTHRQHGADGGQPSYGSPVFDRVPSRRRPPEAGHPGGRRPLVLQPFNSSRVLPKYSSTWLFDEFEPHLSGVIYGYQAGDPIDDQANHSFSLSPQLRIEAGVLERDRGLAKLASPALPPGPAVEYARSEIILQIQCANELRFALRSAGIGPILARIACTYSSSEYKFATEASSSHHAPQRPQSRNEARTWGRLDGVRAACRTKTSTLP